MDFEVGYCILVAEKRWGDFCKHSHW